MKKILRIISFLLLLVSCKDKDKLPEGILSHDRMIAVTWDMLRAGEFLNSYIYNKPNVDRKAEAQLWYEKVYALHKTTREQYDKSYTYYRQHPDLMKAVMDSIGKKTITTELLPSVMPDSVITKRDTLARRDTNAKKPDTLKTRRKPVNLADTLRAKRKLLLKPEVN